ATPARHGTPRDDRAPQRLRPLPLAGGYVKVRHVLPKPAVSMPQSPQTVAGAARPTRAVPGVPGDTPESGCRLRESRRPVRAPRCHRRESNHDDPRRAAAGQTLDAMPGRTTPQRKPTGDGHQ
ncbi:hypothetical protein, partial [Burkholderia cenocepacia]|uniref:hypothetical protein n=1 Tax=Burkholderia cenocepacia TaxID=95486 RepID=UPI001F440888